MQNICSKMNQSIGDIWEQQRKIKICSIYNQLAGTL